MNKLFRTSILTSICLLCSCIGYSQTSPYLDFEPTVFEGLTVIEDVHCPALEGNLQGNPSTQPVKVYLPPGYDSFPENKYPVVYLLHAGGDCNYNTFYSYNNLLNIVNQLISNKTISPMVIVTPNASSKYGNCCYTNSYVTGNWEDYIVQDVIQNIESNYRILNLKESRGLSGFSIGGHGTIKIAMKHPSLFNSIGLIGPGAVNFEDELLNTPIWNNAMITAASMDKYDPNAEVPVPLVFAHAVAFAPDSTNKPILGRFPYTADGVFIDSIWKTYLENDPLTMLQSHRDSLLKINAIQFYIGDQDVWVSYGIERFLQALLDNGIEHGYEIYSGAHDPKPVLDDLLEFFSEHLIGIVPTIQSLSDYYLDLTDTLIAEVDMDGMLHIVPVGPGRGLDSILINQVASESALAEEPVVFQLSELVYGKYYVYAVTTDSAISNIPEEFCLVPDKSIPDIIPVKDTLAIGDPIKVSFSREGTLCLIDAHPSLDTFKIVSEIMESRKLVYSIQAPANTEVSFSTDELGNKMYWIYGYDEYGIIAGPRAVKLVNPSDIAEVYSPVLNIYPNPTYDIIYICSDFGTLCEVDITSLNGQFVFRGEIEGTTNQIDLSSFRSGVYFITIRSKEFVTTRKIVKLLRR